MSNRDQKKKGSGLHKVKHKTTLPLWSWSSWGVICSQRTFARGEKWGWWRPGVVIHLTQELSPPRRKLTPAGVKGWDGMGGERRGAASASARLINGPLSLFTSQRLIHINAAFTPDPTSQLKCSLSNSCLMGHATALIKLFWLLQSHCHVSAANHLSWQQHSKPHDSTSHRGSL